MTRQSRGGFTLVEVMITTVILSIALLPLLRAYFASIQGVAESLGETRVRASAQRLMNRILAAAWEEPAPDQTPASPASSRLGPEMNETQPDLYDDIDDWNGFEGTDPTGKGTTLRVRVDYVDTETGQTRPAFQTSDVKRIVVQAQYEGRTIPLTRLRVRRQ